MKVFLVFLLTGWTVFWYGVSFEVMYGGKGKVWVKILVASFGGPLAFLNGVVAFSDFVGKVLCRK